MQKITRQNTVISPSQRAGNKQKLENVFYSNNPEIHRSFSGRGVYRLGPNALRALTWFRLFHYHIPLSRRRLLPPYRETGFFVNYWPFM